MDFADNNLQKAEQYLVKTKSLVRAYLRLNRAYEQARGEDPDTLAFCLLAGAAAQLESELQELGDNKAEPTAE